MKNFLITILATGLMIIAFGCGANRQNMNRFGSITDKRIPAGVDSALAVHADSISNFYFVDFSLKMKSSFYFQQSKKKYKLCDSLFTCYQALLDTSIRTTASDSIRIYQLYKKGYSAIRPDDEDFNNDRYQLPEFNKVNSMLHELCKKAREDAETARFTDPYHLNARINLVEILILLGKISQNDDYYHQAINELRGFLKFEKSQDNIYALLAECYYALKDWENAYQNFKKAQQVLENTVIFQGHRTETPALDTTLLVYYLHQQGDTRAKAYDDSSAITFLSQAYKLSKSRQRRAKIHDFIDWINWDDGNILAVEMRDHSYKLYNEGKYKKAKKEFKKLLTLLKTERTKNQINWKIATIDFKILNKKNDGIKRLFQVIKNINRDNIDSTSNIYLTDYGAMCYSLGQDYLAIGQIKTAYAYFKQASKIDWEKQAESYFHLAQLSQSDSEETIKNCQHALDHENNLSRATLKKTYQLLVNAYKRSGKFKQARDYYLKLTQTTF